MFDHEDRRLLLRAGIWLAVFAGGTWSVAAVLAIAVHLFRFIA